MQARFVQPPARLIHGEGGGQNGDMAQFRERNHFLRRLLAPDEKDTAHVQHQCGTHGLGVVESREEERLILRVGKDVAHHVAAERGIDILVQHLLSRIYLCTDQAGDFF